MKKRITIFNCLIIVFILVFCPIVQANSDRAANNSSQASEHGSNSVVHAIIGSGQVVSGAASVPLSAAGASGAASTQIADELKKAADAPIGEPLEITEETISIGLPPDKQLEAE